MEKIRVPRALREALIENEKVTQHFRFSRNKVYLTNERLLCKRGRDVMPLRYTGITSTRERYEPNWKTIKRGIIFIVTSIAAIVFIHKTEATFGLFLGLLLMFVGLINRNYLTIFQALPYGMEVQSLRTGRVMAKGKGGDRLTSLKLKVSKKRVGTFLNSFN